MSELPLVVDMDGTLIHSDMLHESVVLLLKSNPFYILNLPFLLARGKAYLKARLASKVSLNVDAIPYNKELIEWLRSQKSNGRRLILCTASDISIASKVSKRVGVFDEVLASNGSTNLVGDKKAELLVERFGIGGFDYVGDSSKDIYVWEKARKAVVIHSDSKFLSRVENICIVEREFSKGKVLFSDWKRLLRVHQWLKNLLLFVPIFAAHELSDIALVVLIVFALVAFCLCASGVYILNDLLDLESDRLHPRKQARPLASGIIPIWKGLFVAMLLILISISIASFVGSMFLFCLILYFLITSAYSLLLKRLVLIDCFALAFLYTLRIVAGAAAVSHDLSFWLLAFSVFLFLSLAFVKRYAELEVQLLNSEAKIHGRGYSTSDASLVQTMGIASGYSSVLVLALYLNSDAVQKLYVAPEIVWVAVPIVLLWLSWMWVQAHRGNMHDDPLLFAVKDGASIVAGILFALVLFAGAG